MTHTFLDQRVGGVLTKVVSGSGGVLSNCKGCKGSFFLTLCKFVGDDGPTP